MSLAKRIADAFGKSRQGSNGFLCRCPCHEDQVGVLAVSDNEHNSPPVQFWCPQGCQDDDILFIASSMDLLKELTPEEKKMAAMAPMLAEFWLAEPEVKAEPYIQNLFDAGDKVVIIGQSKTRKSFFTQQLAFALASGRKFLDFEPMPKRRVLLIQFEIKKDRYHARCQRMSKKLSIEPSDLENLLVINARGYDGNFLRLIEVMVKKYSPEVIIIDPLYKLIQGDESKSEEIKPILAFFDTLAEKSGAAVIYVHHDKKGAAGDQQLTDRGAGSGVLARDFDSAIFLSPHKDVENVLVVEFIARNYPQTKPLTIEWIDYHFALSNAAPDKMTTRSMQNKKVKNSELVERAKDFVKTELGYGKTSYPVGIFNLKLQDIGIPERSWTGIREQLCADGLIEVITQKAEQGRSSKIVNLIKIAPEILPVADSAFKSSFEDEADERF